MKILILLVFLPFLSHAEPYHRFSEELILAHENRVAAISEYSKHHKLNQIQIKTYLYDCEWMRHYTRWDWCSHYDPSEEILRKRLDKETSLD